MKAALIYWTATGNTEKTALAIEDGLTESGLAVARFKLPAKDEIDFYSYDLVCFGFPSYSWMPPKPVDGFIREKYAEYKEQGRVKNAAPPIPGKNALIFCTYSGPHTGKREAVPAVLYVGQYFEHLGFNVLGEWCVLGEFHKSEDFSTKGRLGDIRGRPTPEDLEAVKQDAMNLVKNMK